MATQKFTAAKRENRGVPAVFEMDWFDEAGEQHTNEFKCYPGRIPFVTKFDMSHVASDSEPMWEFFRSAFGDGFEEWERFLKDPVHDIQVEALRDVIEWMQEYDTGLPTTPSAS